MLAVGKAVAEALPACGCGNQSRYRDGEAQQDAEPEKDQFDNAEYASHGRSLPENGIGQSISQGGRPTPASFIDFETASVKSGNISAAAASRPKQPAIIMSPKGAAK